MAKTGRKPKALADYTFDQIKKMGMGRARRLCERTRPRKVSTAGSLGQVRQRLRAAKETPGRVCCLCGEIGLVVTTQTIDHIVKRSMRCPNRRCNSGFIWNSDTRKEGA